MSLTSYQTAPPRARVIVSFCYRELVFIRSLFRPWKAWRRPTLPRLKTQYHRRGGFSRPSSEWDRVVRPSLWPPDRQWTDQRVDIRDRGLPMGVTHRIRSYIPEHVIADGIVNFCTWYRMVSVIVFSTAGQGVCRCMRWIFID